MAVTARALLLEGLIAVGVDDPEPLRERTLNTELTKEWLDLADQARGGAVVWDTFHVFMTEDDDDE